MASGKSGTLAGADISLDRNTHDIQLQNDLGRSAFHFFDDAIEHLVDVAFERGGRIVCVRTLHISVDAFEFFQFLTHGWRQLLFSKVCQLSLYVGQDSLCVLVRHDRFGSFGIGWHGITGRQH